MSNIFGAHAQLRFQMETALFSQFQRLPGLQSEFCGLETAMGLDDELSFGDFLNGTLLDVLILILAIDPSLSEKQIDIHEMMEKKLGMGIDKFHRNL